MNRKTWPSKKQLPRFASYADELVFWEKYDVPWDDDAKSEHVRGPAVIVRAAKAPRGGFRVSLPGPQHAALEALAKKRHNVEGEGVRDGPAPRA
jgi:hypothetical protein